MGFIFDLFFGKKTTFSDPVIGELTARINPKKPEKISLWRGSKILMGQGIETGFFLYGNAGGPNLSQITEIHQILDNFPSVIKKLELAIQADVNSRQHFDEGWKSKIYLENIYVFDHEKDILAISLQALPDVEQHGAGFTWENNQITNLDTDLQFILQNQKLRTK